ncbi:MAG: MBL fold metallo-hydrolase [Candidatus Cyclobacteriaceae bacterium M2_1C_046]
MRLRLLFIFIFTPLFFFQAQSQEVNMEPVKVKDNIYMLKGRGGNIGVSFGKDGVLVIDNQFEDMVPQIKAAIKGITDKEIRFVVNTHYHGDHTGGNKIFGEEGKTIVAHKNVFNRLNTEQYSKFRDRTTPAAPEAARPIITFDHYVTFHLNDETIQVMHFNKAHTDGDAVVYFEDANVIHAGDLYVTYGFPFIDADSGGSLNGFIDTLDKILLLINDETVVIPGHGELSSKKDVEVFRNKLADIRDRIQKEVAAGKDLTAVIAANPLEPYEAEWGKSFIKSKDFITLVYPEFKK